MEEDEMGYPTFHGQAVDLDAMLAGAADLDAVIRAVARERAIRDTVAETGEDRAIVAETLDAAISMDQEAVLDLMEGETTTLARGLARYAQELEGRDELQPRDRIVEELGSLLAYPWPQASAGPGRELEIRQPDDEHLEVWIGGQEVASANHDTHGWAGMEAVQTTAENVHRALTR
jgi:hypothetical protein